MGGLLVINSITNNPKISYDPDIFEYYREESEEDRSVNGLLKISKQNDGKYDKGGFVQRIQKEESSYNVVYSDATETKLRIPKGWYGYYTPGKSDEFTNQDESIWVLTKFIQFNEKIDNAETLERVLDEENIQGLFEKKDIEIVNDDMVLQTVYSVETGKTIFFMYRLDLDSNDNNMVAFLSVASVNDLSNAKELLYALVANQESLTAK